MTKPMIRDPWSRNRLIRDGICRAIHHRMKVDPRVYLMGEGAHMKVHFDAPDIEKDFPSRVLTLPICEDGNSNFAVGLALGGLVPIVDVISSDFLYRTMDAICNTMAKLGTVQTPKTMVIRAEFLTGGPTSGQRIEAMFTHVPGLMVAIPSHPMDAYSTMTQALIYPGVTVFFEDRMIKDEWFAGPQSHSIDYPFPSTPYYRATGRPAEATVVSYGITHVLAIRALREKPCAIFDLKTLVPLRLDSVIESVGQTGKLLIVEPDAKFMGIGAEIVAQVTERYSGVGGWRLKRLGGPRAVIPASRELHDRMIPTEADILLAYEELTS